MAASSSWLTFVLSATPTLEEILFSQEFRTKSQNRSSLALVGHVSLPKPITIAGRFGNLIGQSWVT